MRTRLLAAETALADYEIIEMLLFLGIPRRDTKPLAKLLVNRFGSLAATLTTQPPALAAAGLPPRAIEALAAVVDAAAQLARPEARDRPTLDSWAALDRYFDLPCTKPPGFTAILLNNRNQLLAEPTWSQNTVPTRLSREILRHALEQHASAMILVRHDATPEPTVTPDDFDLHTHLIRAAEPLAVAVHDMLLVGTGAWISIRQHVEA